jgi:DNA segregation ATPase FtsK/SpoIIIE-like protein
MPAFSIFPSLRPRRCAVIAALPFVLSAAAAGAAESPFVAGKIEVTEIKGADFCSYMILEQMWANKDRISGYWRMRSATLEASGKIDIVSKKGKIVADLWGAGSERAVETTKRVGPDLHVNVELNWVSDVWSSDSGFCIVDFVLLDVIPQTKIAGNTSKELAAEKFALAKLREEQRQETDRLAALKAETGRRFAAEEARLAKQRAEEETRLAMLRQEQRKEVEKLAKLKAEAELRLAQEEARRADIEARSRDAERLAKRRAEEEVRLTRLREEQRQEADRLAKLKTEAELRLVRGESLDADFGRKVRDAERLAELQTKEASRLAKLRREQGKEAERLLKLKVEAEQRLAQEEARLASLR